MANPLSNDAKLKQLLKDVNSIKSDAGLASWRKSFLSVYQEYLDPDGVLNARDADGRLIKKLQALAKSSLKVQTLIESKNISSNQVTAEGSRCITNLTEKCKEAETAVNVFCPKTSKDEDKVGYDKFELGAVLIKDGFHAYEIMTTTQKHIQQLKDGPLDGILDRNAVSIINFYIRAVELFIDVMADLGLIGLAKQCVKVYKKAPRPKPSQPGPNGEPPQEDYSEFVGGKKSSGHDDDVDPSDEDGQPSGEDQPVTRPGIKSRGKPTPTKKWNQNNNVPPKKRGSATKNQSKDPQQEDEDEEDDDGDGGGEGEGGDDDVPVLYWDPITQSFGRVSRKKIGALILDQADEGGEKGGGGKKKNQKQEPKNIGGIEDPDEKTEVIWQLKKLEKKLEKVENSKPNWLDEIKKEKAAKKEAAGGKTPKKAVSMPSKRRSSTKATATGGKSNDNNNGWGPSPLVSGGGGGGGSSSTKKPTGSRPKSSSKTPTKMTSVPSKSSGGGVKKKFLNDNGGGAGAGNAAPSGTAKSKKFSDYQGSYKKAAPKPANDGWASVSGDYKRGGGK